MELIAISDRCHGRRIVRRRFNVTDIADAVARIADGSCRHPDADVGGIWVIRLHHNPPDGVSAFARVVRPLTGRMETEAWWSRFCDERI